ncbi:MAG: histidine phosphatase family protein [Rhodospirillaceae bacterium]|nr:histidine phosphatase family protein [Rhodospirillaceae bacterium]
MPENNFPHPTKWWWVRHAPVADAHPAVRISAQLDVDANTATAESIKSIKWLANTLPADAKWITSSLVRTHQTADAIITAGIDCGEIKNDARLNEQNFGQWAGLTWDELGIEKGSAAEQFWQAPATTAPPGGESFANLMARVAPAIDDLTQVYSGRDIVCVAHAGTIRAALAHALGLGPEKALSFNVGNLSLTRIDHINGGLKLKRGGHWRVGGVNIICEGSKNL